MSGGHALHVSKVLVGVHPRAATSDPAEGDLGVDVQEQHHVWDPDAIEPEHPSGAADGPGGRHRWQPARALFGKGFALDQEGEHRAQVIDRRAGARCTPMGRASPVVAGTAHRGEDQVAVAHDHVAPVPAADRDRSVVLEHEIGELQVGVCGAIAKALGEAPKNFGQSRCQREPFGVKARRFNSAARTIGRVRASVLFPLPSMPRTATRSVMLPPGRPNLVRTPGSLPPRC